jgi:RNA recognition motif-containing protein
MKMCSNYGKVEKILMHQGEEKYIYGIIIFETDEEARNAVESLNGLEINGKKIYAQPLQSKFERKQLIQNQKRESNTKLNEQYHLCNLHIRNIPDTATEDDLRKTFEKFGNIKNLKIERYIVETEIGNKYKEIPISKGFGYLCYDNQESARQAMEAYNGKYLDGFESWKRPILIGYFMPKTQRRIVNNQMMNNNNTLQFPPMPFMMGISPNPPMNIPMNGYVPRNPGMKMYNSYPYKQPMFNNQNRKFQQKTAPKPSLLDMEVLNKCETEEAKRDYLGEIIFKAIEESPLAAKYNMSIDCISKITGMIISISNIDEVIHTVQSEITLNNRIEEGLELLKNAEEQTDN